MYIQEGMAGKLMVITILFILLTYKNQKEDWLLFKGIERTQESSE